jgi:tRNA(Leu) C34 or U34 (ribose-2'-O)-methylase TrmL
MPKIPFLPANTGTLRARACANTALALALITAVTPPDWAYNNLPFDINFL